MGDEMPPSWMWPFDEELEFWFEEVEAKRKEKFGGSDSSGDEWSPMMGNDLAAERK